jgi:hypothetical protein
MLSSGMLRCVALVGTDVSDEPSASIIRVTRLGVLGTTSWRNIPEDGILNKSCLTFQMLAIHKNILHIYIHIYIVHTCIHACSET